MYISGWRNNAELQIKEELIDLKKLLLKYRGERTRKRIRAIISLKEKTFRNTSRSSGRFKSAHSNVREMGK